MPAKKSPELQFVMLPLRGVRAESSTPAEATLVKFSSNKEFALKGKSKQAFKVLDSTHENGLKLVEMTAEAAHDFKAANADVRLVPVRYYYPMVQRLALLSNVKVKSTGPGKLFTVMVKSPSDGAPVRNCHVIAYTDVANGQGVEGTTNAQGIVRLKLPPLTKGIELLYVDPEVNFWGQLKRNVKISANAVVVNLKPLAGSADALVHIYGATEPAVGNNIAVAVVDSGIAPHPDLVIAGGLNTVVGEDPADYGDNGLHHGTHVAGIIAARGSPPTGIRGLAPGVALHSYRVFGSGQGSASNYSIAKAIDAAVEAGCHLINLSLGGGPSDEATRDAIADARAAGSVVVAANGNEDRDPVSFPARDSRAIAVSAFGRKGTFPNTSPHTFTVAAPYGTDKKNFLADFSNVGPETDLTGPGVGIISTVPGGYAAWNGTSMATPAVTGRIAALWSRTPSLLGMPASAERSAAVIEAVLSSGTKLGFGADYEGNGRI